MRVAPAPPEHHFNQFTFYPARTKQSRSEREPYSVHDGSFRLHLDTQTSSQSPKLNKYVTTDFRHAFTVTGAASFTNGESCEGRHMGQRTLPGGSTCHGADEPYKTLLHMQQSFVTSLAQCPGPGG